MGEFVKLFVFLIAALLLFWLSFIALVLVFKNKTKQRTDRIYNSKVPEKNLNYAIWKKKKETEGIKKEDDTVKEGFTLIELMVVIAVIGILGVVITPVVGKAIIKAKAARMVAELKVVGDATNTYHLDTGGWPSAHYIMDNTSSLLSDPGRTGWDGPYLKTIPVSPLPKTPFMGVGCFNRAYYYLIGYGTGGQYYNTFDLDKDGTNETTDGYSACIHGFGNRNLQLRLDAIYDIDGQIGTDGSMNTTTGCDGISALYIGQQD